METPHLQRGALDFYPSGAGYRHWALVNRQREEPNAQWKAAAFVRWHEPDDARASCPVVCPVKAGVFSRR
jgi:hypothetical protein